MTSVTYEASAGVKNYTITFPYLRTADLTVEIDGALNIDWTVDSAGTTLLFGDGTTIAGGEIIEIYRTTSSSALVASFGEASTGRALEFNAVATQLLYLIQEATAASSEALKKNFAGTEWRGESLELTDLAPPTEGNSAATQAYVSGLLAASGSLPEPVPSDIGKGIRVQDAGGGTPEVVYGAIDGAFAVFKPTGLTSPGTTVALQERNGGPVANWTDTEVDLELVESFGTPSAGLSLSVSGTDQLVLPAGTWEVLVEFTARNDTVTPTNTGGANWWLAVHNDALTGTPYAETAPAVIQPYTEDVPINALTLPMQVRAYVTVGSTTAIHICAGRSAGTVPVRLIDPCRIIVREILL